VIATVDDAFTSDCGPTAAGAYVDKYALDPYRALELVRGRAASRSSRTPRQGSRGRIVTDDQIADLARAGCAESRSTTSTTTPPRRERIRGLAADLAWSRPVRATTTAAARRSDRPGDHGSGGVE